MLKEYLKELDEINDDYLFEMANAVPKDTGLPYVIWLDSAGKERKTKHNTARIKVEVDGNRIPVSISLEPEILIKSKPSIKDFDVIKSFIINHYDDLMKHWNRELSDREILNILVSDKNK